MKMLDSGDVSDHPYTSQFYAFFQALAQGKEMPMTSLKDALYTHRIIFAADRSSDLNQPEKL
jgi:predicted dehydrogenase